MYTTRIAWFLSSNPALGAVEKNATGGRFTVQLGEPYTIPHNASNVNVSLLQAIIWNSETNIVEGVNNRMFYAVRSGGSLIDLFVTIPGGNYDIHTLSVALEAAMFRNVPSLPVGSFQLYLRGAYCALQMQVVGSVYLERVYMAAVNDIARAIGFEQQILVYTGGPTLGNSQTFVGENAPPIKDGTRKLLLSSTLVDKGMRVNGKYSQVLATINFGNTAPGSQLVYTPPQMQVVPTDQGSGRTISSVISTITNAATGELVDTNGEDWSYVAILSFDQPIYTDPNKKRKIQ